MRLLHSIRNDTERNPKMPRSLGHNAGKGLPRFARNDIFVFNIAGNSVTESLAIKTSSFLARSMVKNETQL